MNAPAWLPGDGEMARRISAHDWSATPLGPVEAWPENLRTALGMVLAMPGPASILWGPTGVQLYNDAYRPIAGDRHPSLLGRAVAEGWPDDHGGVITPLLDDVFAGRAMRLEGHPVALRGPDGWLEERAFDIQWSPIRDAPDAEHREGKVAGAFQTLVEVTDRCRAGTVCGSRARHRLLIESWAQAVWEADADGIVVADSPSWRASTGQILEEYLGFGWLDAIHPDDRAHAERQWREALAARRLVDAEFRLRAPGGDWRWTNVRAAPLLDGKGQVEKWVGMNIDIDARKRAEAALLESEARFRALATVGSSTVYRLSPDWHEMRHLDGAGFLLDTETPTVGWVDTYIPPDERPRVRESIERAIATKAPFELEHRVLRADGTVGWTFSRAIPLLDEAGEIREWFGAAIDVTARVTADQRFTRMFRASPTPFLVLKPDAPRFTVFEVNDAYLAATKRTRDKVVGHGIFEAYPDNPNEAAAEAVNSLSASLERVLATHQPDRLPALKYDIARPDGTFEERWWSPVNSAVLDEDGAVEAIIHNANDVSEERRAEAALRESEGRFRGFAENSANVLWIANATGTRLEYLSPAFERIFGADRDAVMADPRRVRDLVHPDDRALFDTAMPRTLAGETVVIHYRVVSPAGTVVHLRDTGFPIRDAPNAEHPEGSIRQIAGVVQDVSDIPAAQAALEAEKERFRTLAEGIPQLVWRSADDGLWTWSSPQWQAYTGQTQLNSLGWDWLDVVHPDDHEATRQAWHGAQLHGRLDVEYRVRRASDGTWRWHQTRSVPVRNGPTLEHPEGRILEWLGTTTDIEDLKRLQGQQEVLVAELQHRTRNLLAVVRNLARRSIDASAGLDQYDARLSALGRVQGFLSRSTAYAVPLADLVQAELEAAGNGASDRVTVGGPDVGLPGESVQVVALALHELATNAVKYGALAQPAGRLSVNWHIEPGGRYGSRRLVIGWRESGVDMPPGLPERRGHGTELITQALPYQLEAETALEFAPDGVRSRIALPARAFTKPTFSSP